MSQSKWTRSTRSILPAISTFALLLEASARGHKLLYYTPDKLSLSGGRVVARAAPVEVRDIPGDHFTLGDVKPVDLASA